jgi:four helix bundle protein
MSESIRHFRDLKVYKNAFKTAMQIHELTKYFPANEKYSLTDQIRRSSRSVCANLAEAWRKRRYEGAFIAKLSDAESEAAETQVWFDFALECHYINQKMYKYLDEQYERIIKQLINMVQNSHKWLIKY